MFSCEYCEIFKSNYFEEHLRTAAFFRAHFRQNDCCSILLLTLVSEQNFIEPYFYRRKAILNYIVQGLDRKMSLSKSWSWCATNNLH